MDVPPDQQCRDLTIRKEILWESQTATDREVNASAGRGTLIPNLSK